MGTPEFAVPSLEALKNSKHKVISVYSQPASKANRGQKLMDSKVGSLAKKFSLNLRTPKTLDSDEEFKFFSSLKPDIVVVVAYGQIIPKRFLDIPKFGFINVHASLLPKWRGAAPIQRSIMNLDKETGISIMQIVEKLDAGPVCNTYKINLENNLNADDVAEKLSLIAADKILDNIDDILDGRANFIEQDHSKATYAPKIQKIEGDIDWNERSENIIAKINGLSPKPGAFFIFKGERYKILKAEVGNRTGKPGEIISDYMEIACGDNKSIKITEIQRQGKMAQKIEEFSLGSRIKKGFVI